jgi:SAM-dependent methyltransferase
MEAKDLVRPLLNIKPLALARQRLQFTGSSAYWERRYATGGNSGAGSYGSLACGKAEFLNDFVRRHRIASVIEFGCGDGHQLSLANYPHYVGLDVSKTAIGLCRSRFEADSTKSFFLYDGDCFIDHADLFTAELAMSLDVIFHLIEEDIFATYMTQLFGAARRYVVVYATNGAIHDDAPHVRHRPFTSWVEANCPQWQLAQVTDGPRSGPSLADFFVYERRRARPV